MRLLATLVLLTCLQCSGSPTKIIPSLDGLKEKLETVNGWVKIPKDWHKIGSDEDGSSEAFYIAATDSFEDKARSFFEEEMSSFERRDKNSKIQDSAETLLDRKDKKEPYFDHARTTNVSEHLGSHAILRCKVKNLGDRTVSWIRQRDWHILTSGYTVYTNDERFQIVHHEHSDEWSLIIQFVQMRDNGTYECQVPSGKKTLTHFFNLHVLVPTAHILGAKDYHVQQGTVISLVCIIENSPKDAPPYLFWYHNNEVINLGSGMTIHTEPGVHTHSRLTVPSAGPQHAGNYTCGASNTEPATVQVYVSDGDKTAAIHSESHSNIGPPLYNLVLTALIIPKMVSLITRHKI